MSERNTVLRSMHDVGLAAWFGGSLMGAIGVNGAAGEVDDPRQRSRVANSGWARWTPVNGAAIAAHAIGGLGLIRANGGRIGGQEGVEAWTWLKTATTLAALGATGYSRVLGRRMQAMGDQPVESGTESTASTPPEVEGAQRQLRYLQWAIPALTGSVLVMSAFMGEQQRPNQVLGGVLGRLKP